MAATQDCWWCHCFSGNLTCSLVAAAPSTCGFCTVGPRPKATLAKCEIKQWILFLEIKPDSPVYPITEVTVLNLSLGTKHSDFMTIVWFSQYYKWTYCTHHHLDLSQVTKVRKTSSALLHHYCVFYNCTVDKATKQFDATVHTPWPEQLNSALHPGKSTKPSVC